MEPPTSVLSLMFIEEVKVSTLMITSPVYLYLSRIMLSPCHVTQRKHCYAITAHAFRSHGGDTSDIRSQLPQVKVKLVSEGTPGELFTNPVINWFY
jgi:hypothetical protein